MKIIKFLKEFWRENKNGYLITCALFSIAGFIVYAATTDPYDFLEYLMMLPFFFVGIYILALFFGVLIYGGNKKW